MYKKIELQQGSSEWLEFRRSHVTATDAMKIMEECPVSWGTPYTCWLDKLMKRETTMNDAMKRGIELEPIARKKYEELMGINFSAAVVVSNIRPWQMSSLDGLSECSNHAVEIKCGKSAFESALNGEVKSYYIPQLQHHISILDLDKIDYFCYWEGNYKLLTVDRDEKYIQSLLEKESQFYDCLTNIVEPKCTLGIYEQIDTEEAAMLKLNLETALDRKKVLESEIKELKSKIESIADGRNICIDNLQVRRKIRSGNIDYSLIPIYKGVNLNQYRKKPTEYYDFRFLS